MKCWLNDSINKNLSAVTQIKILAVSHNLKIDMASHDNNNFNRHYSFTKLTFRAVTQSCLEKVLFVPLNSICCWVCNLSWYVSPAGLNCTRKNLSLEHEYFTFISEYLLYMWIFLRNFNIYTKTMMLLMGYCKKDVTPLLTHWSYVFLALTHRYAR